MDAWKDELYHHGILGQKWGIRRYQNKDGSYTEEGLRRRGYKEAKVRAKKEYQKAYDRWYKKTDGGAIDNVHENERLNIAEKRYTLAKRSLENTKIWDRIKDKPIPKSQKALVDKYRANGMSEQEALVAAYKNDKAKKIMILAGAITVAAAAAYGVTKYRENNVDRILEKGTLLSRISESDTAAVHDGFYAALSSNKLDVTKYKGLYGSKILSKSDADRVYQKSIQLVKDVKVAPRNVAKDAMKELLSDPDTREEVSSRLGIHLLAGGDKQKIAALKGLASLKTGKNLGAAYDAFNMTLMEPTNYRDKFYEKLKSRGYGAVIDVNDKKLSNYFTKMPIIMLDSSNVHVNSVKTLGKKEVNMATVRGYADVLLKSTAETGGPIIAGICAIRGISTYMDVKNDQRIVSEYRKDHPNSSLSADKILDNYYSIPRGGY